MENKVTLLQKKIIWRGMLVSLATLFLNFLGSRLDLYSILWWYDMPMHFLGGLFSSLIIIYVLLNYSWFVNLKIVKKVLLVLFLVFVVGILWEGYELFFAIITKQKQILLDSTSDIFFDIAGGIQGILVYLKHKNLIDK